MDIFVEELTNRLVGRLEDCSQNLRSCPLNQVARFRQEMNFINDMMLEIENVYKDVMEGDEFIG